jgi:WD40 repeat protein
MTNITPELVIIGHSYAICALAFSADGKTLVSDAADQTAIIWDVDTGQMRRLVRSPQSAGGLALTPDGQKLIIGDSGVWDAVTGRQIRRSYRYHAPLACSPNGKLLASSAFNPEGEGWVVLVCDVTTGRTKHLFPCSFFQPTALAFSADGNLVGVTGSVQQDEDTYVSVTTVYDLNTGQLRQTLHGCDLSCLIGVSPLPSTRLIGLTSDGKQVLDVETEQILHTIEVEKLPYSLGGVHDTGRSLSPDGRLMLAGTYEGHLAVYEVASSRLQWQTQAHCGMFRAAAFTADSQMLATAGDDHIIRLWNAATGTPIRTLGRRARSVEAVAFSPDGEAITALNKDGTARFWTLHSVCCERQENSLGMLGLHVPQNSDTARNWWRIVPALLPGSQERRFSSWVGAVSPDGSLIFLSGYVRGIFGLCIWNVATQTAHSTLRDIQSLPTIATFSPDNRLLALASGSKWIRLYDTQTGRMVRELTTNLEDVGWPTELRFSSDGRTLASGDGAYTILLWDVETGKVKRRLDAYGEYICSLAFAPDDKTLAVGAAYSEVVWLKSLGQGRKHRFLRGHTATIRSVTFSGDGTRLATGAQDGTVRLWNVTDGTLVATFLALPDDEWIIYTPDGHYSGSPGAEQYLLWKCGDDLLPADAFSGRYRDLENLPLPVAVTILTTVGPDTTDVT